MGFSLGLRHIFSYVLPGAVSIIILAVTMLHATSCEALLDQIKKIYNVIDNADINSAELALAYVGLSIIVGLLANSSLKFTKLTNRFFNEKDPRLTRLDLWPSELQESISRIDDKNKIEFFYYGWCICKMKCKESLEFALFGIFAMNFCARVGFIAFVCIWVVVLRGTVDLFLFLIPSISHITFGNLLESFIVFSALLFVFYLSRVGVTYYQAIFINFGIRQFTGLYDIELETEQKNAIRDRINHLLLNKELSKLPSNTSFGIWAGARRDTLSD